MSEVVTWKDSRVDVQAWLVPRFIWMTASIDVYLGEQCILRTGGQLKSTGSQSTTFSYAGSTHTAELKWGASGFSFSFPYVFRIDGVAVEVSRVRVRNWPIALVPAIFLIVFLEVLFQLGH